MTLATYLRVGDAVTSTDRGRRNVYHWTVRSTETELDKQVVIASAPGQGSVRFNWTPSLAAGHGHGLLFKAKQ